MADTKISAFGAASTPLTGSEIVAGVQGGVNKKITTQDIADLASGGGIAGSGTLNTLPKFTPDGTTLGDSGFSDDGTTAQVLKSSATGGSIILLDATTNRFTTVDSPSPGVSKEAGLFTTWDSATLRVTDVDGSSDLSKIELKSDQTIVHTAANGSYFNGGIITSYINDNGAGIKILSGTQSGVTGDFIDIISTGVIGIGDPEGNNNNTWQKIDDSAQTITFNAANGITAFQNFDALTYSVNGAAGASGSWTAGGVTVTVTDGIITSIV